MAKEETRYFWTKTCETFAGKSIGEDVTDFFTGDIEKGKVKKDSRLAGFIAAGKISDDKPETYEAAENGELVGLRKSVESQKLEIEELKKEIKQTPKTLKEAKKRIKDLECFIIEKDEQIAELTAPGGN